MNTILYVNLKNNENLALYVFKLSVHLKSAEYLFISCFSISFNPFDLNGTCDVQ